MMMWLPTVKDNLDEELSEEFHGVTKNIDLNLRTLFYSVIIHLIVWPLSNLYFQRSTF